MICASVRQRTASFLHSPPRARQGERQPPLGLPHQAEAQQDLFQEVVEVAAVHNQEMCMQDQHSILLLQCSNKMMWDP
jgi:hypothetical protein